MTRGKNDKIDARRIAVYAQTHQAKLQGFEFPARNLLEIKQLLTYRDQLVRTSSSYKNSIKSHKKYEEVLGTNLITKDIKQTIKQLEGKILEIEIEIKKILESDQKLMDNFRLATSVKLIGFIISAFMLITTNNFTIFDNDRKYPCYAGIAPFEYSSGKFKGTSRVNHLANKKMKTLLSDGANSAKSFDTEMKAYYKRKTEEGKDHKLIMNSISCKLINKVFAVVKRGTPYVSTYGNNFA
jgi:transposase